MTFNITCIYTMSFRSYATTDFLRSRTESRPRKTAFVTRRHAAYQEYNPGLRPYPETATAFTVQANGKEYQILNSLNMLSVKERNIGQTVSHCQFTRDAQAVGGFLVLCSKRIQDAQALLSGVLEWGRDVAGHVPQAVHWIHTCGDHVQEPLR